MKIYCFLPILNWHLEFHFCFMVMRYCCDRKGRAECTQSFTLWQQATIEITRHDHSVVTCSRQVYMVLFFAHIPFVVNRAFSATPTARLQQYHELMKRTLDSILTSSSNVVTITLTCESQFHDSVAWCVRHIHYNCFKRSNSFFHQIHICRSGR